MQDIKVKLGTQIEKLCKDTERNKNTRTEKNSGKKTKKEQPNVLKQ
jgi:hypothetical protein